MYVVVSKAILLDWSFLFDTMCGCDDVVTLHVCLKKKIVHYVNVIQLNTSLQFWLVCHVHYCNMFVPKKTKL